MTEEAPEDPSSPESPNATDSAEEEDTVPTSEHVVSQRRVDTPVEGSDDPVSEDAQPATSEDDAVRAIARAHRVEVVVGPLIRRLERFLSSRRTNERVDYEKPPVRDVADETTTPVPADTAGQTKPAYRLDASSFQTAGIETGVETLDLPAPTYPSLSRRRGEEGLVMLQVEVLPDGSVGAVTVLRDAGFARLAEAAIAAARRGRFHPATRNGQPIRATVRIPFRFVLR